MRVGFRSRLYEWQRRGRKCWSSFCTTILQVRYARCTVKFLVNDWKNIRCCFITFYAKTVIHIFRKRKFLFFSHNRLKLFNEPWYCNPKLRCRNYLKVNNSYFNNNLKDWRKQETWLPFLLFTRKKVIST